jgi:hypothetical protein
MKKTNPDEPIPYVSVDPNRWDVIDVPRKDFPPMLAGGSLGRSPDTVPANENTDLPADVWSKPLRELRTPDKRRSTRCPRCKTLLAELDQAVRDFTTLSRPLVAQLAQLSHNQVKNFEEALKPTAKRVQQARAKFEKHQREASHG